MALMFEHCCWCIGLCTNITKCWQCCTLFTT